MTLRKLAKSIFAKLRSIRIPALLTRMSARPQAQRPLDRRLPAGCGIISIGRIESFQETLPVGFVAAKAAAVTATAIAKLKG
jgi:hypothetical protein